MHPEVLKELADIFSRLLSYHLWKVMEIIRSPL